MVASFATITHSRPDTRPTPQIIEAECTSPLYIPQAASWPISRNGEPGSSSLFTRSRGSIFPRATCFSLAAASPPCDTVSILLRRSETNPCIRSAFAFKPDERGLSWLLSTLILPPGRVRSPPLLEGASYDHALDVARAFVDLRHAPTRRLAPLPSV